MIYIDDNYPEGTLEPSFTSRDVTIKRNVDAKQLYELISEIGRGKFGTVYKCKEKSTGLKLAAKFVPIPKREDRRNVEREVELMNSLQHPLIIQLYAAYEYQKMMCVVLELIEGGELFDRVVDDDFVLTERVCTVFMRQVCEAMQFIHRNNILHLDLKPENILCITKEGNRIKLIDFGLARKYDPDKKLQILFGTPEFVAPEVVNFDCISYGTDMWSVGVICYVLLSGLSPFMGETDIETMANVTIAKYDFDDEAFNNVSPEALDFISKLLIKEMSLRMTASECLEHKWLERRLRTAPTTPINDMIELKQQQIISTSPVTCKENDLPKYTTTPPTPPPVTSEQPPPTPSSIEPKIPPAASASPSIKITANTEEISEQQQQQQPSPPSPTKNKKELLEQTKDNLKTFIERWEEHPNSPYVFDTESYLITPVEGSNNKSNNNITVNNVPTSKNGSSNVSSRACSPSPCESIISFSDDHISSQSDSLKNKGIISENEENYGDDDENDADNTSRIIFKNKNFKDYLHSFDRRNSDTNYLLGRRPSGESRINLADEIRKLSEHLLMLAEINTKLGNENDKDDDVSNQNKNNKQQFSSSTSSSVSPEKLETIQESLLSETKSKGSSIKSKTMNRSVSVIDSSSLKTPSITKSTSKSPLSAVIDNSSKTTKTIKTSSSSSSTKTKKSTKISSLSVRLQQSLDETSTSTTAPTSTTIKTKSKVTSNDERAAKLINGFKQQLLSTSSSMTASNYCGSIGVPWPITNKRTKFRINQMSRDVPIGSPDTHQPIDLEDAANTTKDCLLHLLEKYNERKIIRNQGATTNSGVGGPYGRHQSISIDWNNLSDNLEYQSISSINAFFRRHSTRGNYVKQLQAQLEAKSKQN